MASMAGSPNAPTLAETEAVFSALAHRSRREILLVLSHLGGELPSGYLAARFRHSWPTTTRHLNVLQRAGLVEGRRHARNSHYRIDRARLLRVVGRWLEHLEPPTPARTWTSSGPKSTRELARGRGSANPKAKGKRR